MSFKKRNAKCHSSGFYDSATNFTLSGQLISAASVNFCSNTWKQSAHTSSKHWARAGVSSNIRKAGIKEVSLRSSSARSSSPQTDTRWVIPCSSPMENSLSQSGLKITQNSSRKCLCGISSFSASSPRLLSLFWSSSSLVIIKATQKAFIKNHCRTCKGAWKRMSLSKWSYQRVGWHQSQMDATPLPIVSRSFSSTL